MVSRAALEGMEAQLASSGIDIGARVEDGEEKESKEGENLYAKPAKAEKAAKVEKPAKAEK